MSSPWTAPADETPSPQTRAEVTSSFNVNLSFTVDISTGSTPYDVGLYIDFGGDKAECDDATGSAVHHATGRRPRSGTGSSRDERHLQCEGGGKEVSVKRDGSMLKRVDTGRDSPLDFSVAASFGHAMNETKYGGK